MGQYRGGDGPYPAVARRGHDLRADVPARDQIGWNQIRQDRVGQCLAGPGRTSPYKFYQFWINQGDADTPAFLKYFTFLGEAQVADLERQIAEEPHRRAAQRALAEEVTRLVHGEEALANAVRASQAMFGGDLKGLDNATLQDVFSEVPSSDLPRTTLTGDRPLLDVLVECGAFQSKGEARRMVANGGLYLNNERVDSADAKLTEQSLCSSTIAVVRKGKKSYHLLRFGGE